MRAITEEDDVPNSKIIEMNKYCTGLIFSRICKTHIHRGYVVTSLIKSDGGFSNVKISDLS